MYKQIEKNYDNDRNNEIINSGRYYTLPKLVNGISSFLGGSKKYMREDESLLKDINNYLDELGFRRFKIYGYGQSSLVLDTVEEQLINISVYQNGTNFRPNVPQMLQAVLSKDFDTNAKNKFGIDIKIRVDIVPKLKDRANISHVWQLKHGLHKEGKYIFFDGFAHNVRLLPDRKTPVVIDGSAFLEEYIKPLRCRDKFLLLFQSSLFNRNHTWEGKQERYFEKGEFKGLVSKEIAEKLQSDTDKKAIKDVGLYPEHYIQVIAQEYKKGISGTYLEKLVKERISKIEKFDGITL